MRIRLAAGTLTALMAVAAAGCASQVDARYIYQDGEYGVIGIPSNSPFGRKDYRKQAEELMTRHFPEGFEVVRAEEVVEGQRVLDKSRKSEFETDPAINALNQRVNIGKIAQSMVTQQKDSLPILESRIIYRRRTADQPRGYDGFAAVPTLKPELYLDPNEMARCREKIELADLRTRGKATALAAADKDKDRPKDDDAKKASHDSTAKDAGKDGDAKKASHDAAARD